MSSQPPKVAIVHDWLVGGGAERVILELHRMYPDAPIYTSYATDEWRQRLDDKVITGWLQHFGKLRKFMVLGRIWWFTHLDLSDYDLVISSSGNGEAKSIRVGHRSLKRKIREMINLSRGTTTGNAAHKPLHICYCHAPTHYYWRHYDQYLAQPGFGKLDWLARLGLKLLVGPLRRWDKNRASTRPDYYIANSTHTASEIKTFYGRESSIVCPPIDIDRFMNTTPTAGDYFITVGRQTSYKKTDLIIQACNELSLPLIVVGRGPQQQQLADLAGPTVTLRTDVTDEQMPALVAGARGFIFAAFEDFGIAPVEALAAGTPLVAYRAGGALDYVQPGKTGVFFDAQSTESLTEALRQFNPNDFNPQELRAAAAAFAPDVFQLAIRAEVTKYTNQRV